MCSPVIKSLFSPEGRAAAEAAYDKGETSYLGRPLSGPGEGSSLFNGGLYISRPRGSTLPKNTTGYNSYLSGKPSGVSSAFTPAVGNGSNRVIS